MLGAEYLLAVTPECAKSSYAWAVPSKVERLVHDFLWECDSENSLSERNDDSTVLSPKDAWNVSNETMESLLVSTPRDLSEDAVSQPVASAVGNVQALTSVKLVMADNCEYDAWHHLILESGTTVLVAPSE